MHQQLDSLRSFVWWTTPLYAVFLLAALFLEDFSVTPTLELLIGVLIAFGLLDGLVLLRVASIQARAIRTPEDLEASQRQIQRLSRMLLLGGGAFGAAFLIGALALAWL